MAAAPSTARWASRISELPITAQGHAGDTQPLLDVRDLRVEFDTGAGVVCAVDGISFNVAAGETLGIVGESGSGKSVTAMSLVGLVPAPPARIEAARLSLGGVDLLELDVAALSRVRGKRIGFVFQEPLSALNPVMTLGRQVGEVIECHLGGSRAQVRQRAAQWLGRVGIPHPDELAEAYPHQLSGGMRQRAMIAMALAAEPELLIADEPTTALDVTVQAQIVDLMRRLRDDLGMALIWISHDLGVIAGLADRVAVMRAGKIVETASAADLYANPEHPYTRQLMTLARQNALGAAGSSTFGLASADPGTGHSEPRT